MTFYKNNWRWLLVWGWVVIFCLGFQSGSWAFDAKGMHLPSLRVKADMTYAPQVPPPITRHRPAVVEVYFNSYPKLMPIKGNMEYNYWTFNGHVPGPFIRVRVGDVLEVHSTSSDPSGRPHNIDFHAVTGPGGGANVTTVFEGQTRVAWFKMLHPGLFVYHCGAAPVMDHIANGMYGLILVEPKNGLPPVNHEYYVMQSEFYTQKPKEDAQTGSFGPQILKYSHQNGLNEDPTFVVFNGHYGALLGKHALKAKVHDKVRIFFGNIGPNLISSFHVIGESFDDVYREGDLTDPPAHNIQTTLVPAGGTTVVDLTLDTAGTYKLVDHAIFRIEQGAIGLLKVSGPQDKSIYASDLP